MPQPRKLLPKPGSASREAVPLSAKVSKANRQVAKARTACFNCRQRKSRCHGQRPACTSCVQRDLTCEYPVEFGDSPADVAEWRAAQESRELVSQLQDLPYDDALELFRRIRQEAGSSRPTPTKQMTPSIPASISNMACIRSCLPSTSNSLEFELAVRYPIAYPTLYSIPITSLPLDRMLKPIRIKHQVSKYPQVDYNQQDSITLDDGSQLKVSDSPEPCPTTGPTQARPLIYESLGQLEISYWTDVPISNDVAAQAISLYMEIDYPVLPLFHADLFIQDLIQQRSYFCSRFLVSALLAWACQAYTAIQPDIASLTADLFVEAEKAFSEISSYINTLTTVSGLQLMCMTAVTQGRDDVAIKYLETGVKVGVMMGLFGIQPNSPSANSWLEGYQDWQIAASYTAWGVYNWVAVYGLHYQRAVIEVPPTLPMPGDIEIAIAMHGSYVAQLNAQAAVFRSCCYLFTIFHDVLWAYYGQRRTVAPSTRFSIAFAEAIYRRLLMWAEALPLDLVRSDGSSHYIMMMHIYYHAIVTDVFRPFLAETSRPLHLSTFSVPGATPEAAYRASVNQLKRLLLIYRLNFEAGMLSVVWQTGLIYVANAVMREVKTSSNEWRYYLNLCMAGLEDLYVSFRVFGSIAKAMLSIALEHGALEAAESRRIKDELEELGRHHAVTRRLGDGREVATWIIDLDLAITDPEAARGSELAERFQALILEDGSEEDSKNSEHDNIQDSSF